MRFPSFLLLACAPCLLLLAPGCGGPDTAEQQQADQQYAHAQELLAAGDHHAARQALRGALTTDRSAGRDARVAEEERMLAASYAATASFDTALQMFTAAQNDFRKLADRPSVRSIELEIAGLCSRMGDERKAFERYSEALRFAKVFHDEDGIRAIEWAMLPSCRALDKREDERHICEDLLRSSAAAGDSAGVAKVYLESGISLLQQGRPDSAAQALVRAFTVADKSGDSLLPCSVLHNLARAYDASGKEKEAFQAYAEALTRTDKLTNGQRLRQELLMRVGNVYLRRAQSAEAARFYRAALTSAIRLKDKVCEGYAFIQLGHCESVANRDAARRDYQSALDLFTNLSYGPGVAYARLSLAILAGNTNQVTESIQLLKSSVDDIEAEFSRRDADDVYSECEHAFLGPRETAAYDELVERLLQLARTDEAFTYASRRRAALMFRALGSLRPRSMRDSLTEALEAYYHDRAIGVGAERQLEMTLQEASWQDQALADIRAVIQQARGRVNEETAAVAAADRRFQPFVGVATLSLADVQKLIPQGSVAVQYLPTRRTLYALVISRGKTALEMAAVEEDRLAAAAAEFLDSLRTQPSADSRRARELSGMLYAAFVRPIEPDLAGASELLVILPDNMPLVPIHALRRGMLRSTMPLAEQTPVSYLPSSGVLALNAPRLTTARDILALGHPGSTDWDVEYELRDIRAFYKEARLYFGQQATLATLQREHADLLHLAAEFQWNERVPGNSCIVLPDSKSPEIVRDIPLGDLVGLPAFPTVVVSNLAREYSSICPAEPYLFLANGSSMVVMDGYPLTRKNKKYFGEVFYTALLSGVPAREAFQRAQLEMMRNPEYASVNAWAAFFSWGM